MNSWKPSLVALAAVGMISTAPSAASAAPADFTYKDRQLSASLSGPEDPTAAHPTVDLISAGSVMISGSDILTYRTRSLPALDASASLTGDWLGCDTATDELVSVTYNGSSPLPEGSVTVTSKLTAGSLSATWPVEVTVERTPNCSTPNFDFSTTTNVTESVHVELSVVSDGSPTVSSSERDPETGSRSETTYQPGTATRVVLDGEFYVPDWQADMPPAYAAGLSSYSSTQRY